VSEQLYSVGTWDTDAQAYTPQLGLSVPSFNVNREQLRKAMKELRKMGYSVHRYRDSDGSYDDNDFFVLIERTDGESVAKILDSWKR
jgi:hypothetical protein